MSAETLEQARERLRPHVEAAQGFSGWSDMPRSREIGAPKPWDYISRAIELVSGASSVLDIGTGGGERLSRILEGYRFRAVATEEWHVNAPVANAHLRPLGVDVVWSADEQLPSKDSTFDLVLDRHSALSPRDVARVLSPGGTVLTQQLQPDHWREVRDFFARAPDQFEMWGNHFENYQRGFSDAGLALVDVRLHEGTTAYDNLADFVYMLCITPWTIPGFDPLGTDLKALLELEAKLTTPVGLALSNGSYIIEARKPG
ncbi:MAG: methyltransferase domain-containing protein [Dehalococcoidia bacterium]|nr:methyltransferase domain-containing protein [Dehalococcoidia bacterium]